MCKPGVISQERLKIYLPLRELRVKLQLSANRKSYMPRRLAQRMTLSDFECLKLTSSASRAISTVVELLVQIANCHGHVTL